MVRSKNEYQTASRVLVISQLDFRYGIIIEIGSKILLTLTLRKGLYF